MSAAHWHWHWQPIEVEIEIESNKISDRDIEDDLFECTDECFSSDTTHYGCLRIRALLKLIMRRFFRELPRLRSLTLLSGFPSARASSLLSIDSM